MLKVFSCKFQCKAWSSSDWGPQIFARSLSKHLDVLSWLLESLLWSWASYIRYIGLNISRLQSFAAAFTSYNVLVWCSLAKPSSPRDAKDVDVQHYPKNLQSLNYPGKRPQTVCVSVHLREAKVNSHDICSRISASGSFCTTCWHLCKISLRISVWGSFWTTCIRIL